MPPVGRALAAVASIENRAEIVSIGTGVDLDIVRLVLGANRTLDAEIARVRRELGLRQPPRSA